MYLYYYFYYYYYPWDNFQRTICCLFTRIRIYFPNSHRPNELYYYPQDAVYNGMVVNVFIVLSFVYATTYYTYMPYR